MTKMTLAALLLGAVALSACSNDRFSPADGTGPNGVNDPTSTAYFNTTIGDRILFEIDQSTLTPLAMGVLAEQASWLNANPAYTAIIEGHADEQGTREYNVALGARRASAVQSYLVQQGVAPDRLKTVSYGKERPLAICSDESCYEQNRRAVTVLSTGAAS